MTLEQFWFFMMGMFAGGILFTVLHVVRPVTGWDRILTGEKRKNEE